MRSASRPTGTANSRYTSDIAGEQQREELQADVGDAAVPEEDEGVADGEQAEHGGGQRDPPHGPVAQDVVDERRADATGWDGGARTALTNRSSTASPTSAIEKLDDEHGVEGLGDRGEDAERHQRPRAAPRRRRARGARRRSDRACRAADGERDHGVTRCGADALADAVGEQHARRADPDAPGEEEREPGDGRECRSRSAPRLVP